MSVHITPQSFSVQTNKIDTALCSLCIQLIINLKRAVETVAGAITCHFF